MKKAIASIKVLAATICIFAIVMAAPFLVVIASIALSLIGAWLLAKLLFMD
jgi:hypothetical protein